MTRALPQHDSISVRRWFAFAIPVHIALLAAIGAYLYMGEGSLDFSGYTAFQESVAASPAGLKLLIYAFYLSVSCTFFPLNTGWLVSAVAMQQVAIAGTLWETVLWVSLVGSAATTLANLNDYHLFTLTLRTKFVGRIRNTRIYRWAAKHFDQSPVGLLLMFNILPIPIDAARMLAAGQRYSRVRFAAANFIGRFIRYAIIAGVTYQLGKEGWIAPIALLGVAVIMLVGKFVQHKMQSQKTPEATNT